MLDPFKNDLPIPDVIHPTGSGAIKNLRIAARVASVQLHADLPPTSVWRYERVGGTVAQAGLGITYLGPTVEVERGLKVQVEWKNQLQSTDFLPFQVIKVPFRDGFSTVVPQNEPGQVGALSATDPDPKRADPIRTDLASLQGCLVTHLHGGRTPADFDGWPDNTCIPRQSVRYTYPNDQNATMLWYHDHAMHVTRLNVYAGLAGSWLIRDSEEAALGLPSGRFEIPLVIQDRNLELDSGGAFTGALLHKTETRDLKPDGTAVPEDGGPAEFFGPFTLVNGVIWPKLKVEKNLYRFRVLNGSNARTYRLLLLNDQGRQQNNLMVQIGCDQGLLENKQAVSPNGLVLAPGERVDLLIDFSSAGGQKLYLWNTAEAPYGADPTKIPSAGDLLTEFNHVVVTGGKGPPDESLRRPYPQVMRFDVRTANSTPHRTVPADPLWSVAHSQPVLSANMPIRLMALVERGVEPAAPLDDTSMLVFFEYVQITPEKPAPPGAE
jgi:FtsP/CotA-like multicopper oxidase with cupredoxin domain